MGGNRIGSDRQFQGIAALRQGAIADQCQGDAQPCQRVIWIDFKRLGKNIACLAGGKFAQRRKAEHGERGR